MNGEFGEDIEVVDFDVETNESEIVNEEEAIVEALTEEETEEVEGGASVSKVIRKSGHTYGNSATFKNVKMGGIYDCSISSGATLGIGKSTVTIAKKKANFKGTVTGTIITKLGSSRVKLVFTVSFR